MESNNRKFSAFLRRNAFYIVLALCIIAVILSAIFAINANKRSLQVEDAPVAENIKQTEEVKSPTEVPTVTETTQQVVKEEVVFIMPVDGAVIEDYSELVWNPTLKWYESHKAIDFEAVEGTSVLSVYGGTVESITTSPLTGTSITIDHGNGLKSYYNSLSSEVKVKEGQKVKKGAVIGEVSASNLQENSKGSHLHFAVSENGEYINPEKYLALESK